MVERIGHRTLWTFVDHVARARHGHARQPRRVDGAAGHPHRPRRVDRGSRVDGQRVHADVRRLPPHRRRARRPVRAAAHVRRRPRDLHRGFCAGRAGAVDRGARGRTRAQGVGGAIVAAADADDPQRGGSGRAPWPRARRVGWHRRPGRRTRPARRRRGHRGPVLAVDLLDQRADRPRPHAARVAAPGGDARPLDEPRPARARARQRRALRHRLGPRPRQRPGLDEPGDRVLTRRGRGCS